MALAHLCLTIKVAPELHPYNFRFYAFIVDHRARPGSAEEACFVKKQLQSWGLLADVINLEWPAGVEPAQLPNFETQARRLRYQALGTACRDKGIPHLFMAHHEDDQAESMLLRLVRGHSCLGLQGIQPLADIPECEGIHGVYQSGLEEFKQSSRSVKRLGLLQGQPSPSTQFETAIPFEDGGVTVCRPLLKFSKDRLRATCQARGVQWAEDKTNHDPTRTSRNAIRYLLRNRDLPQSLQKPSLLALRDRMCSKARAFKSRANTAFERCHISMLDTRTGALVIRLPSRIKGTRPVPPAYRHQHIIDAEYKVALMLRQVLNIVSPQQQISSQSLEFAVDSIFPDIKNPTATNQDKILQAGRFTAGGVSFQRVVSPWQRPDDSNFSEEQGGLDKTFVWALTRQPFANSEDSTIQIGPAQKHPTPESQPIRELEPSQHSSLLAQSAFHFWDSRYWIRVYNPTSFTLRIQPLSPENLRQLRSSLIATEAKLLDELLRVAAPGKVRWTLPVLLQNETEDVVALPTLGWANGVKWKRVEWEVRYKKVTLPRNTDVHRVVL